MMQINAVNIVIGAIAAIGPLLFAKYVLKSDEVKDFIIRHNNNHIINIPKTSWLYPFYFKITKGEKEKISWSPFSPSGISFLRTVVAIAVIMLFIYFQNIFLIYLLLFAFGHDAVDGEVARQCKLTTEFGKWFDPLCDKISYLLPIIYSMLSYIIAYIFSFAEYISQFPARHRLSKKEKSIAATNLGKIKAALAFGAAPYFLLFDKGANLPNIKSPLLIICTALSFASTLSKLIRLLPDEYAEYKKYLANFLTSIHLGLAIWGLYYILAGSFMRAFILTMIGGQSFDALDGRAAMLYGSTPIGKWLDDLADTVSFGINPTVLIIKMGFPYWLGIAYGLAIVFRLLRFVLVDKRIGQEATNFLEIQADRLIHFLNASKPKNIISKFFFCLLHTLFIDKRELKGNTFAGLPSPGAALVVWTTILLYRGSLSWLLIFFIIALTISRLPFAHFSRDIIPKAPRVIIVITASIVFALTSYAWKHQNFNFFPFFALFGGGIYIIFNLKKHNMPNMAN